MISPARFGLEADLPVTVGSKADAQLGDRSSSGDSGVGNRVFAQIAQFMGNTENRGKVIWFLLTCRPDLLPVDLKRQGRAEEHIALFYPETAEDRSAMLRAMLKKTNTNFASPEEAEAFFQTQTGTYSGADVEALLIRTRMRATLAGSSASRRVSCLRGFSFCTLQNPQPRVQRSPRIMKVAAPRWKHSWIFGQRASSHTVCSFRSRNPRFNWFSDWKWVRLLRAHSGSRGDLGAGPVASI